MKIILTEQQLRWIIAEEIDRDKAAKFAKNSAENITSWERARDVKMPGNWQITQRTPSPESELGPSEIPTLGRKLSNMVPGREVSTVNDIPDNIGGESVVTAPASIGRKKVQQPGEISFDDIAMKMVLDTLMNNNDILAKTEAAKERGEAMRSYALRSGWLQAVAEMGKWYEKNVHTYQGTRVKPRKSRQSYYCPLIGGKVCDDCSSFVKACLQLFGISEINTMHVNTESMQPGSKFDRLLLASGFKRFDFSKTKLLEGDIICGGARTHTEIYAGNGKSWAWGNVHDGKMGAPGMPCPMAKRNYLWTWRFSFGEDENDNTAAEKNEKGTVATGGKASR